VYYEEYILDEKGGGYMNMTE